MITPMEAEENGCRLSPSAYVSEEYDLEIGVTDLDLEVLMCENSKLQAELEEIQDVRIGECVVGAVIHAFGK